MAGRFRVGWRRQSARGLLSYRGFNRMVFDKMASEVDKPSPHFACEIDTVLIQSTPTT